MMDDGLLSPFFDERGHSGAVVITGKDGVALCGPVGGAGGGSAHLGDRALHQQKLALFHSPCPPAHAVHCT